VDERMLPSGDVLIVEQRSAGSFLQGSGLLYYLYLRRTGESKRELVAEQGWFGLRMKVKYAISKRDGWLAITIGREMFFRRDRPGEKWQRWELWARGPLYAFLRQSLISSGIEFDEVEADRHPKITVSGWKIRFGSWDESLLYEVADVDFASNRMIARLRTPVGGLPETLVFRPSARFDDWIFSAEETQKNNE